MPSQRQVGEELAPVLSPSRARYVLGCLPAAAAKAAIWLLPEIPEMNALGVERMLRLLSVLQAPLVGLLAELANSGAQIPAFYGNMTFLLHFRAGACRLLYRRAARAAGGPTGGAGGIRWAALQVRPCFYLHRHLQRMPRAVSLLPAPLVTGFSPLSCLRPSTSVDFAQVPPPVIPHCWPIRCNAPPATASIACEIIQQRCHRCLLGASSGGSALLAKPLERAAGYYGLLTVPADGVLQVGWSKRRVFFRILIGFRASRRLVQPYSSSSAYVTVPMLCYSIEHGQLRL